MNEKIVTVSQLTQAISILLEDNIGTVAVQGEISNFKIHSSGHRYFTLKDEGAQVSCTMWKQRPLAFLPADGMKVIVHGDLTVYPPRGQYQLECHTILPMGKGDLYLAFEALKKKLDEKGYFDSARKRLLPVIPMSVGVSTSPTGAAIKDIISTINRRFPLCTIYFRPTLVQGEGSAEDIVRAIDELNNTPADILIIGRGGGSLEDLWSYNTEIVAEAIYHSKKPVISAVGHETDFTIADFVADRRAATPTAAAEIATPKTYEEIFNYVEDSKVFMEGAIRDYINELRDSIDNKKNSYGFRSIPERIKNNIQQTDEMETRINQSLERIFKDKRRQLNGMESHFGSLHPLSPLRKGFALLENEGKIIKSETSLVNYKSIEIVRLDEIAKADITQVESQSKYKI